MKCIHLIPLCAVAAMSAAAASLPSPALLVLNKEDATLVIVNPVDGRIAGRVGTGEGPHEVAASSDGRYAYVANYGSKIPGNSLSVIDLEARKELRRVDLSPMQRPHGITVADGKVWFTAEGSKLLGRYDPVANKVDQLLGTGQDGTHMVLVSKDKSRIFAANIGSSTIYVFEKQGANWTQTAIPVGKGPEGFDLTPDGRELWTAHSGDGGVSVIDLASKHVATFDVGTKRSNRLKFTPDGKRVLVSDLAAGEVIVVDAETRKAVRRLALGKAPEGILIPSDGKRAFIAVSGDNRIDVLDLETLAVVSHIQPGNGPDGMAWIGN